MKAAENYREPVNSMGIKIYAYVAIVPIRLFVGPIILGVWILYTLS
jgi:hypothetical protein